MRLFLSGLVHAHNLAFSALQRVLEDWFLGLAARLTFGSVLAFYFWGEALKNVRARDNQIGVFDYLTVEDNAYAQLAPKAFEAAGMESARIGFDITLGLYLGTLAEFVLPVLIVLGLFTRLASLATIGFIGLLTWIEVTGHGSAAFDPSRLFDRLPNDPIMDQRLLWLFPLIYLLVRGGGLLSLDRLLTRNE